MSGYGQNPSSGKVNPHNGAVVRGDDELFADEAELEALKAEFGLNDAGVRLGRSLNLI